jgi:hypothetical protein
VEKSAPGGLLVEGYRELTRGGFRCRVPLLSPLLNSKPEMCFTLLAIQLYILPFRT